MNKNYKSCIESFNFRTDEEMFAPQKPLFRLPIPNSKYTLNSFALVLGFFYCEAKESQFSNRSLFSNNNLPLKTALRSCDNKIS